MKTKTTIIQKRAWHPKIFVGPPPRRNPGYVPDLRIPEIECNSTPSTNPFLSSVYEQPSVINRPVYENYPYCKDNLRPGTVNAIKKLENIPQL